MEQKAINWRRSEAILEYFRSHPFISPSAVANHIGYDQAALSRLINKTGRLVAIPAKHLDAFEGVLKDYGF